MKKQMNEAERILARRYISCANCLKTFCHIIEGKGGNKKYCSDECRNIRSKRLHRIHCRKSYREKWKHDQEFKARNRESASRYYYNVIKKDPKKYAEMLRKQKESKKKARNKKQLTKNKGV